ncbi:hypothetical protein ACTFIN_07145 [Clostridium cagae]|uniref:hypothetical protein n=1 Tax=Clostridium cagae TaxID=2080751 RepID=UPI003F7588C5
MDYLQKVIDEEMPRGKRGEGELNFLDLLINKGKKKPRFERVNIILDKVDKLNNEINSMFMMDLDKDLRYEYITLKKQQVIKEISKLKVDKEILYVIFKRINNDKKDKYNNLKKSGLLLLNIIYNSHKDIFMELLKDNKSEIKYIEEDVNGSIKIYDKVFEMKA